MNKQLKHNLIGIMLLPVILFAVLAPFSMFVGWNLFTMLLMWFIVMPFIAVNFSTILKLRGNHLVQALAGLIIFYGFMVFMIYKHFKTDFFLLMMTSAAINILIVLMTGRWKSVVTP
jgi:hypothetical protein